MIQFILCREFKQSCKLSSTTIRNGVKIMNKYCKNCNYELNGSAFCPQCGKKAETQETATIPTAEQLQPADQNENIETTVNAPAYQTNETDSCATAQFDSAQQNPVPQQPIQSQPSAFSLTIKHSFNVIKNFFSKNVVDAISAQHEEKLKIWIILFAIPALFSAISSCIHYSSPVMDFIRFFNTPYSPGSTRISFFFSGLLYALAFEFSFVIVLFLYSRLIKKKPLSFNNCANLVSSAFLPITVVSLSYIVLGSNLGIANSIAFLMFIALLHKGLQKAFNENGGFWIFYLVVAVAIVTFILVSFIISTPAWITNTINNLNPYSSIFDSYSLY